MCAKLGHRERIAPEQVVGRMAERLMTGHARAPPTLRVVNHQERAASAASVSRGPRQPDFLSPVHALRNRLRITLPAWVSCACKHNTAAA